MRNWRPVLRAAGLVALACSGWASAGWSACAQAAPMAQPAQAAATPDVKLRWEVVKNVFAPPQPEGRSLAALVLTPKGASGWPASGWALYFSAIAGVETGPIASGNAVLERVSGTLFRLKPTASFATVAPGQSARIEFYHPEIMLMADKAPQAPYVVWDARPDVGVAIVDYQLLPLTQPQQLELGASAPEPLVTPEALYQKYRLAQDLPEAALPPVFPTPGKFEKLTGQLVWTAMPGIDAAPALRQEARLAHSILQRYFTPAGQAPGQAKLRLRLESVEPASSPEAYRLEVSAAGVTIAGNSAAAVSRGVQSLRELLPLQPRPGQPVELAALRLQDAPRFEYRGVQLDVARNFQSKATVLRLLDLMARFKLNKFHFHLTEDEGWRMEIAGLPELTSVGAHRGHPVDSLRNLPSAYGSGPDLNDPHGSGFYTRQDYIDIVRHAAALHIEVIPEIEMPGHARAAVKAMEYRARSLRAQGRKDANKYLLSDPQDQSQYRSAQLYTDHVVNPGMASSYTFIEHVVAEMSRLHRAAGAPLRNLHVGGDELPAGAWQKSPATLALMRQQHLDNTAEVWNYFYNRVDGILRHHGIAASGWEELGARNTRLRGQTRVMPNPAFVGRGFTVYVWNNLDDSQDLAYRLANAGYKTVLAPVTHMYFDMAHTKSPQEQGHNWGAYVDLDTVFDFVPFDFVRKSPTDVSPVPGKDGLTELGQRQIRGLEATLFTETMRLPQRIDYMLMPRMLALAQRAWVADPAWANEPDLARATSMRNQDWSVFANVLGKKVLPRLDYDMPDLAYRIAPPGLHLENGQIWVNHQLPGLDMRYTNDGSEPSMASPQVHGPISTKGDIRVSAFSRVGRIGKVSFVENR